MTLRNRVVEVYLSCNYCNKIFSKLKNDYIARIEQGAKKFYCIYEHFKLAEKNLAEETFKERFWEKVDKTPGHGPNGDCWIWFPGFGDRKYPKCSLNNKDYQSSKVSYCLSNNLDFNSLLDKVMAHDCDNTNCVNPNHLQPKTQKENMQDAVSRGRLKVQGCALTSRKATEDQVKEIRSIYKTKTRYLKDIAQEYNLSITSIMNIVKYKTWKHIN